MLHPPPGRVSVKELPAHIIEEFAEKSRRHIEYLVDDLSKKPIDSWLSDLRKDWNNCFADLTPLMARELSQYKLKLKNNGANNWVLAPAEPIEPGTEILRVHSHLNYEGLHERAGFDEPCFMLQKRALYRDEMYSSAVLLYRIYRVEMYRPK